MNADGSQQTLLTTDGFNSSPRWRPLVAPASLGLPTVTGNDLVTSTLTASPGTWSGSSPLVYSYEWRRCDTSGASCVAIAGATASTYTLQDADAGATVRVAVTATNGAGAVPAVSGATGTIASAAPTITFAGRTAANAAGWNTGAVTVTWHCISPFGPLPDVSKVLSTEGAGQSATGTCTDSSNRTASNTVTGIDIEETAPAARGTASRPPDVAGWYNHAVTFAWSATSLSGGIACDAPTAYAGPDSGSAKVAGSCTDAAGLTGAAGVAFEYDATPPVLSGVPATIDATARSAEGAPVSYDAPAGIDAVAGPVPVACAPASGSTFPVGDTTVTCTAADGHGNTASARFLVHVAAAAHGCSSSPGGTLPLALLLAWLLLGAGRRRRAARQDAPRAP